MLGGFIGILIRLYGILMELRNNKLLLSAGDMSACLTPKRFNEMESESETELSGNQTTVPREKVDDVTIFIWRSC